VGDAIIGSAITTHRKTHPQSSQLGGLLFGYDIGATSGVLQSLTSEKLSGVDW
jgi:hypothetical protein